MNPGDGSPNRVVGIAKKFKWVTIHVSGVLELYSLTPDAMRAAAPLVSELARPAVLSVAERDSRTSCSRAPASRCRSCTCSSGSCAEAGQPAPAPDHTHMFCALAGDPLAAAMAARGNSNPRRPRPWSATA